MPRSIRKEFIQKGLIKPRQAQPSPLVWDGERWVVGVTFSKGNQ